MGGEEPARHLQDADHRRGRLNLNSRMIAYPFRLLQCCLVTDGGGALILVAAERARDFPQKPVYLLGTGESVERPMVSQMQDFISSRAFRVAGAKAFAEAGITHNDVAHLMIYDAPVRSQGQALRICLSVASKISILCRTARPADSLPSTTPPPASPGRPAGPAARGSRSIPMAVGFPTCIPACTACTRYRRGCARCAASPPPRSRRQDLGLSWCGRHVRRVQHHHHVEREAMSLGQASGAGEPRPFLGGGEDKKTRKGIRGENAWLRSKISAQSDVCDPILAPFSVRRRCRW